MLPAAKFNLFLCLYLLLAILKEDGLKVTSQYHNSFSRNCNLEDGSPGVCVPLRRCPSGLERFRKSHQGTCWIHGYNPYVCCDPRREELRRNVGEQSKQNCFKWYPRRRVWFGSAALVGGIRSLSREFPHMAALGYKSLDDPNEVSWACGGSLISEKFVLTAAHCSKHKNLGTISLVRLGDLNLKTSTDDANPKDYTVLKIHRHTDYKAPSQYHDIALLELNGTVEFNDYIKPACLQTQPEYHNYDYVELIATGWGNLKYSGPPAEHLQKVYLDVYNNAICNNFYEDVSRRRLANGINAESQICAGDIDKDTCQGDSGGPLQIRNFEQIDGYTIVGVTSFGRACGLTDSPGVYTRVSYYIKWIESIVWKE